MWKGNASGRTIWVINLCIGQIWPCLGAQLLHNIWQFGPHNLPRYLPRKLNPARKQLHPEQPAHINVIESKYTHRHIHKVTYGSNIPALGSRAIYAFTWAGSFPFFISSCRPSAETFSLMYSICSSSHWAIPATSWISSKFRHAGQINHWENPRKNI